MAGLLVGLELLSTLNEKDECLTLLEILSYRDNKLTDLEIWAVCRECCVALNSVYNSPTMFQTLCITPDTVAFNIDGTVCFLDLGKDPELLYVPPEYDSLGNSTKGHMFSLGMTILYAAVYSSVDEPQASLDPEINKLILAMTDDNYDNRPDVDEVLATCERNLATCSVTSLKVCQWLIAAAKDVFLKLNSLDSPDAELQSPSGSPGTRNTKSRSLGSAGMKSPSSSLASDSSSPNSPVCDIISPPDLYCDAHSHGHIPDAERAKNHDCEDIKTFKECESTSDCMDINGLQRSFEACSDVIVMNGGPIAKDKEQEGSRGDDDSGQNLTRPLVNGYSADNGKSRASTSRDDRGAGDVMPDEHRVITGRGSNNEGIDLTGAWSEGPNRFENGAESNTSTTSLGASVHTDSIGDGSGGNAAIVSSTEKSKPDGTKLKQKGRTEDSLKSVDDGGVNALDAKRALDNHKDVTHSESTTNSTHVCMGNESSSEEANVDGSSLDVGTGPGFSPRPEQRPSERDKVARSLDLSAVDAGYSRDASVSIQDLSSQDEKKGQLVIDVLKNLGALSESELWALCRECMLTLLQCKHQLPVYISLDNVAIEADGHVTFHSMPDGKELDPLYLAPELQEAGFITDKACLYSISAMLWSAADYCLPVNEEPALSDELESLLASMIQEDVTRRPEVMTVLEACTQYQDVHGTRSDETCAALIAESKVAAYSKENTFILDVISQELEQKTLQHHAKLMESIKQAKVKLKPVSERQLPDRPMDSSLHDLLMTEIKGRHPLRKVGKPKEFGARELYERNPELLSSLVHVTRRGQPRCFDNAESAFTAITKSLPTQDPMAGGAAAKSEATVPSEYSSMATHFTPIEISRRKNVRPQMKVKSQFLGHKPGPSQKTSEIVRNIQEMKKNILRIQETRTLVQDLERDVQREESGLAACDVANENGVNRRPQSQRSSSTNTSTTPSASGNGQEESNLKQSVHATQPCTVPLTLHPAMLPVQYQLQQDPVTGLVNLVPVALTQNMAGISNPYLANQSQPLFPLVGMQMPVSGAMMPGQYMNYGSGSGIGLRTREEQDSKTQAQPSSCPGSIHESPRSQTISDPDVAERSAVGLESTGHLNPEDHPGSKGIDLCLPHGSARGEYPFTNSHPIRPRQVKAKDQMAKLKRAKSGSSIDYYRTLQGEDIPSMTDCRRSDSNHKTGHMHNMNGQERATRVKRYNDSLSPNILSSPDSGICGLNGRGFGDPALMEKLLNSNRKLSKLIHLLRDEFAFDGYMENGVEDLAVAEYVMSLANLRLKTFCDAITEKYNDLYWDESLLLNLYEVVNEEQSAQESRNPEPVTSAEPSCNEMDIQNNNRQSFSSKFSEESASRSQKFADSDDSIEGVVPDHPKPRWVSNKEKMSQQDDPRQRWTSQWRSQDQLKSSDYTSSRDLSNATYLHNSCLDGRFMRYSLPSINGGGSPSETVLSRSVDDLMTDDSQHLTSTCNSKLSDDVFLPKSPSVHSLDQQNQRGRHGVYRIVKSSQSESGHSTSLVNINRLSLYENRSYREQDRPRSLASQPRSLVTRSSVNLASATDTDVDAPVNETPADEADAGVSIRIRRSEVAYYHADVGDSFKEEIRQYLHLPDCPTIGSLEKCLYKIDQELMLQHRNRQKSLNYFLRLVEFCGKAGKVSDQKPVLQKTTEELEKCQNRIAYLDAARKYVEMLYCEQWSLSPDLLGALARCHGNCPMLLAPGDNTLLQYQTTTTDGMQTKVLQAGLPVGLMAYLYAEGALSEGYIHEFFYCYRYFVSPVHLLKFIINKYEAAVMSLSPESQIPLKIKSRSLDLLYIWLDGYFRIDFQNSPSMMKILEDFAEKQLSAQDGSASDLMLLLEDCKDGCHVDLVFSSNTPTVCDVKGVASAQTNTNIPRKTLRDNLVNHPLEDEWKSFKAVLQLSAKSMKMHKLTRSQSVACIDRMNGMTRPMPGSSSEKPHVRHSDGVVLMDYTPRLLAEQLTLMEQELFQKSHPIHYLNSKAQGIGVDLTGPIIRRAQSVVRLNTDNEEQSDNLFVGSHTLDDVIHLLIEHAQGVAFWVASEVINCKSSKIQVSLLCHLINTAKVCAELRNFATCLSILDGLQNPFVKLLPTWRNLPSKYRRMFEQLTTLQLNIKSNGQYLVAEEKVGRCPTIPCILMFLLHIQREELGGYTLANSMYKWSKMRSITKMVDQIRQFQQTMYDFQPDRVVQDIIRYRMENFGGQDLTWFAAEQAQSLHASKRKMPNVFQRMRQNFQNKRN